MIRIIDNFLSPVEIKILKIEIEKGHWKLNGTTYDDFSKPIFWNNDIFKSRTNKVFTDKIQNLINRKISVEIGRAHV